jgi:hypothetical protein
MPDGCDDCDHGSGDASCPTVLCTIAPAIVLDDFSAEKALKDGFAVLDEHPESRSLETHAPPPRTFRA